MFLKIFWPSKIRKVKQKLLYLFLITENSNKKFMKPNMKIFDIYSPKGDIK